MDERDAKIAAQAEWIAVGDAALAELKQRLGLNSSKPPSRNGLRKQPVPPSLRVSRKNPNGEKWGMWARR